MGGDLVNNRRSLKGWIKIALFFAVIACLYRFGLLRILSFDFIVEQRESFHYNAISLSSVLAGFQFTGISILLSVTDKPRIERLWNYGYLDTLYRVSIIGIIFNVATILISLGLITIRIDEQYLPKIVFSEIFTMVVSLAFFTWSIKELLFVIRKAKNDNFP